MFVDRERFNSSKPFPISFENFGLKDYTTALTLMQDFTAERDHNTSDQIWFMEHYPVFSCGIRTDGNDILNNKKTPIVKTDRGGQVTYHGPGQIVGYPILDLDNFFTDIHKYLRFLEEAVILTLKEYGLEAERSSGETGVWFDVGLPKARKICALGVKSSRWVTMHGFAFNVNADLSYFGNIIPCGIVDKKVFSALPEHAWIVNVARGSHVVTADLVDALRLGTIGGAALDVTDPEPLPDGHPLWKEPNCLITPHIGNTPEMGLKVLGPFISENVKRFCNNDDLLGLVDVDLGY